MDDEKYERILAAKRAKDADILEKIQAQTNREKENVTAFDKVSEKVIRPRLQAFLNRSEKDGVICCTLFDGPDVDRGDKSSNAYIALALSTIKGQPPTQLNQSPRLSFALLKQTGVVRSSYSTIEGHREGKTGDLDELALADITDSYVDDKLLWLMEQVLL